MFFNYTFMETYTRFSILSYYVSVRGGKNACNAIPLTASRGRTALIGADPTSEAKGIKFKMLAIFLYFLAAKFYYKKVYFYTRSRHKDYLHVLLLALSLKLYWNVN